MGQWKLSMVIKLLTNLKVKYSFRFLLFLIFILILAISSFYRESIRKKIFPFEWVTINLPGPIQGDAHLLRFNETYWLIDTGYREAANTVITFLKENNISTLDKIFISHPHFDHYGGIVPLLQSGIKIHEIYFNIPSKEFCLKEPWGCFYHEISEIITKVEEYHIPIKRMKMGDNYEFQTLLGTILPNYYRLKAEIIHLYENSNSPIGDLDFNDQSAIMLITHGSARFLFTGDLNAKLGFYLSKSNDERIKNIDILKVPHHGATSLAPDSFFYTTNPKYMIVPAHQRLWCEDRSNQVRSYTQDKNLLRLKNIFVAGFDGNIKVNSYGPNFNIKTEFKREKTIQQFCSTNTR